MFLTPLRDLMTPHFIKTKLNKLTLFNLKFAKAKYIMIKLCKKTK
jgi:hypothetical protein